MLKNLSRRSIADQRMLLPHPHRTSDARWYGETERSDHA
jgi:hypothetical protein